MAQRERREGLTEEVFETKAKFNRLRRHQKTVYNGRFAFARARGLDEVTVEPFRNALPHADRDWWSGEGKRLTVEADDLYSFGIYCFYIHWGR